MLRTFFLWTFFLCFCGLLHAQVRIASWNLQNFGKTKSEAEIQFIAKTLKDFDVVALQEVVAGPGGSRAVARLADALNRTGKKWNYKVSDPTESTPYATERYAYLWKPSRAEPVGRAWLDKEYVNQIDREPYLMNFKSDGTSFTLVSFHAIPRKKQPETEIKYFKFFPGNYPEKNLIFLGDFNIPQDHTVFNPLKSMGYRPALQDQRTSMKMECEAGNCLASEFDNIFFSSATARLVRSGIIRFYRSFPDMIRARRISDHVPVWVEICFP